MAVTAGTQLLHEGSGKMHATYVVNGRVYKTDALGRIHDVLAADVAALQALGFQAQDPKVLANPCQYTANKYGKG